VEDVTDGAVRVGRHPRTKVGPELFVHGDARGTSRLMRSARSWSGGDTAALRKRHPRGA
jgi:hypothetical protein